MFLNEWADLATLLETSAIGAGVASSVAAGLALVFRLARLVGPSGHGPLFRRASRPTWLLRTVTSLGFALAIASPAAAQSHAPVSPGRSRGTPAAEPWSVSGGGSPPPLPLEPAGPSLDEGTLAGPEELQEGEVEDVLREVSVPHPAIHGKTPKQTPARVSPLFPRARIADGQEKDPPWAPPLEHRTDGGRREEERERVRRERRASMQRHPAGKGLHGSRKHGEDRAGSGSSEGSFGTHVVIPGDTLWDIAQETLRTEDQSRVARYWPRIHRQNRALIGPDPNLLLPGQALQLPPEHTR